MSDETAYLVEVNVPPREEAAAGCRYIGNVYMSLARAKLAVEFWANRDGSRVHWVDASTVLIAYMDGRSEWAYKVVPLGVVRDGQPEVPPGT